MSNIASASFLEKIGWREISMARAEPPPSARRAPSPAARGNRVRSPRWGKMGAKTSAQAMPPATIDSSTATSELIFLAEDFLKASGDPQSLIRSSSGSHMAGGGRLTTVGEARDHRLSGSRRACSDESPCRDRGPSRSWCNRVIKCTSTTDRQGTAGRKMEGRAACRQLQGPARRAGTQAAAGRLLGCPFLDGAEQIATVAIGDAALASLREPERRNPQQSLVMVMACTMARAPCVPACRAAAREAGASKFRDRRLKRPRRRGYFRRGP